MPKTSKPDFAQNALRVVEQSTGEKLKPDTKPELKRIPKKKVVKEQST